MLGPCDLGPPDPTHLVVTTTDFSTGAISVVGLTAAEVTPDVALSTTDAVPLWRHDRLYVLHRFGHDFVEWLDPSTWTSTGQWGLAVDDVASVNPHGLALPGSADRGWVSLFGTTHMAQIELGRAGDPIAKTVDLSSARTAAGGSARPDLVVACGDMVLVSLQQLDDAFSRTGPDLLIGLDATDGARVRLGDDDAPLRLSGEWLRQLRVDPTDPSGTTLLGLTSGLERIDLASGTVQWVVPPEDLQAAGIDFYQLPQAFDVTSDGHTAIIAAYETGFGQVNLYRVGLDGADPPQPVVVAEGFDSVERTLEIANGRVWYGSTRSGESGMWAFALPDDPTAPLEVVAGPLSTGLPPYSVTGATP